MNRFKKMVDVVTIRFTYGSIKELGACHCLPGWLFPYSVPFFEEIFSNNSFHFNLYSSGIFIG
jgi:hypothetical protein